MIVTVLTLFLPSKTEDDVVMLPFLPAFSGIGNWMDLASEVCDFKVVERFQLWLYQANIWSRLVHILGLVQERTQPRC